MGKGRQLILTERKLYKMYRVTQNYKCGPIMYKAQNMKILLIYISGNFYS